MRLTRPRYRSIDATPPQFSLGDRLAILAMFLLPIPSFLGDVAARAADAVRFGAVSGRLLLTPRLRWGRHLRRTSAILLVFFCCAGLSMVFGISYSLRDVLDVLRVAAFWLVFYFGASLPRRNPSNPPAPPSPA